MAALSRAEQLALWTMRRIACGPQTEAMPAAELWWGERADVACVAAAMRAAFWGLRRSGAALVFACSGSATLTVAERGLLIALRAAQSGDEAETERVLRTLLPMRAAVRPLATVLGMLAAAMASDGEWLPADRHGWYEARAHRMLAAVH